SPQLHGGFDQNMTTFTIVLTGGSPWGFRLQGGREFNEPVKVAKINPNSKAFYEGLQVDDSIVAINGQPINGLNHSEVQALIKNATTGTLTLLLQRDTHTQNGHVNCGPRHSKVPSVGGSSLGSTDSLLEAGASSDMNGLGSPTGSGGMAAWSSYGRDNYTNSHVIGSPTSSHHGSQHSPGYNFNFDPSRGYGTHRLPPSPHQHRHRQALAHHQQHRQTDPNVDYYPPSSSSPFSSSSFSSTSPSSQRRGYPSDLNQWQTGQRHNDFVSPPSGHASKPPPPPVSHKSETPLVPPQQPFKQPPPLPVQVPIPYLRPILPPSHIHITPYKPYPDQPRPPVHQNPQLSPKLKHQLASPPQGERSQKQPQRRITLQAQSHTQTQQQTPQRQMQGPTAPPLNNQPMSPPGYAEPAPMKEFMKLLQEDLKSPPPKEDISIKQQYEEYQLRQQRHAKQQNEQQHQNQQPSPGQTQQLLSQQHQQRSPQQLLSQQHQQRSPQQLLSQQHQQRSPQQLQQLQNLPHHQNRTAQGQHYSPQHFPPPHPASHQQPPNHQYTQPLQPLAILSPPLPQHEADPYPFREHQSPSQPRGTIYRPTAISDIFHRGSPTPSLPGDFLRHKQASPTPSEKSTASEYVLGGGGRGRPNKSRGINLFLKQQERLAAMGADVQADHQDPYSTLPSSNKPSQPYLFNDTTNDSRQNGPTPGLGYSQQPNSNLSMLADAWEPNSQTLTSKSNQDTADISLKNIAPIWKPGGNTLPIKKEYRPVRLDTTKKPVAQRQPDQGPPPEESFAGRPPPRTESSSSLPTYTPLDTSSNFHQPQPPPTSSSFSSSRFDQTDSRHMNGDSIGEDSRLPPTQSPYITLLQKSRELKLLEDSKLKDSEESTEILGQKYPGKPVVLPEDGQLPRGAQYIGSKQTTEGDKSITETYYTTPAETNTTTTTVVTDVKPVKYDGIGPVDKEGVPLGFRKNVDEEKQRDWYKQMYKSLHKTEKKEVIKPVSSDVIYYDLFPQESNTYKPTYSFPDDISDTKSEEGLDEHPYRSSYGKSRPKVDDSGYRSEPEGRFKDLMKYRSKSTTSDTKETRRNPWAPSNARAKIEVYRCQPRSIMDYEPGFSSIAFREQKSRYRPRSKSVSSPKEKKKVTEVQRT
ncbi:unnamed protein product, partial [Lymnaea stagnalis]